VSLLDPEEEEALAAIRRRAWKFEDVHVDARYRSSVRLRRRLSYYSLGALRDDQVETLLEEGGGLIEAVPGLRQTDFKSRRRNKALGLDALLHEIGYRGRVVGVGDGEADLPMAGAVDALYAPRGSHPGLERVARMTRHRRQRGLLEAVLREHPGPRPRTDSRTAGGALLHSLLGLRDRSRPFRLAAAVSQAGLEVFRC
jgi:hydroxymethylpyrimidine pyrophosphatase-like HAD family hydrolase